MSRSPAQRQDCDRGACRKKCSRGFRYHRDGAGDGRHAGSAVQHHHTAAARDLPLRGCPIVSAREPRELILSEIAKKKVVAGISENPSRYVMVIICGLETPGCWMGSAD